VLLYLTVDFARRAGSFWGVRGEGRSSCIWNKAAVVAYQLAPGGVMHRAALLATLLPGAAS